MKQLEVSGSVGDEEREVKKFFDSWIQDYSINQSHAVDPSTNHTWIKFENEKNGAGRVATSQNSDGLIFRLDSSRFVSFIPFILMTDDAQTTANRSLKRNPSINE